MQSTRFASGWAVTAVLAVAGLFASPVHGDTCIAHHPLYIEGVFEVDYANGCTGHDEPELDPLSSLPGSAQDATWTVVLPADGAVPVAALGPTFWFGGPVNDTASQFGQAFVELQFYPDSLVSRCGKGGGFAVSNAPNVFTACSPVFAIVPGKKPGHFIETAVFNAMLVDSASPKKPLVMHAGDTVTVHWYTTAVADGWHVTVVDVTTGHEGTIVLNSATDGPLMPSYSTQALGNALGWGFVNDAPIAFVWEIGHTSIYSSSSGATCSAGDPACGSYDGATWAGITPIQIQGVTFADGSQAKHWATVSDQGGKAEVLLTCPTYGGPDCIYPWYSQSPGGFHYGIDYPDSTKNFGKAGQFTQTLLCGGPNGADSTYCATVIK
jgi:hypothetical protein